MDPQASANPQDDQRKDTASDPSYKSSGTVPRQDDQTAGAPPKDENQIKIEQLTSALQRCMADLQNFKKRAEKDRLEFFKFANAELLKALFPILDNFDRACRQIPDSLKEDPWAKGVLQTHDEFMKTLEKTGVKKIETVGQKLDLSRHEAVLQGAGEKDIILEELEPGYTYFEETLKPAKVKVGA